MSKQPSDPADYFDAHAKDLRREALVDKWTAVSTLFSGLRGGKVLEVGAGTGLYTLPLLRRGYSVTAVDVSNASLSLLREAAHREGLDGGLTTVHGSIEETLSDLGRFDVVAFIKVLHHLPDTDTIRNTICSSWRNVTDGGRLVIFEPSAWSPVWPIWFRLRGTWSEEQNTRLMKPRFLLDTLAQLPGAHLRSGFRYLIPGTFTSGIPWLDRLDRAITSSRSPIRWLSGNLWFTAERNT